MVATTKKLIKFSFILLCFSSLSTSLVFSQRTTLVQTIRGVVVDKASQQPLIGVSVIVNTTPQKATVTDENGVFRFENVPVGNYAVTINYVGYNPDEQDNLSLTSGKELILKFEMIESVVSLNEVTVSAYNRKDQPLNEMATVSARSFTVDETKRYAGTYGDPARMAAKYAGVTPARDNRNDIIIRGNSSMGLLWRIDDVEITNPNHFGASGTTGGPITVINSNLLSNSDFFTGAFPAEYGNALAGVFDLRLRTGNAEKREYWAQLGWNGLEAGAEGPISKKNQSTYMISYRYSITDLIERMGIDLDESSQYQDLTFKLNFPKTKIGSVSLFGIGGLSNIKIQDSQKPSDEWTFPSYGEDLQNGSNMGVVGLTHLVFFNANSRLKTTVSISGNEVLTKIDTFTVADPETHVVWAGENSSEVKYSIFTQYKSKLGPKNEYKIGAMFDSYHVNYVDSQAYHGSYKVNTNSSDIMNLVRGYGEWQHKFTQSITLYSGIYGQYFLFNQSWALEPRAGMKWDVAKNHTISAGLGMHSQMQPRLFYFVQTELPDGTYALTNKDMDFSKAFHMVLSYDYLITKNLRLKLEGYYQHLYDIPVQTTQPAYSLINVGAEYFVDRYDSLVNKGTGDNYGLELTFEKYFSKNFFWLFTTSLSQSYYYGYDNIKRNTAFNSRYAFNVLGGYEVPIRKLNSKINLGVNFTWAEGLPYLPYDGPASQAAGEVVYDWANAYELRRDPYRRISFRLGYIRNTKRFSTETSFDLQYRSNYTNVYMYRVDVTTGEVIQAYTMGFYPMACVKFMF
jgi:hypothetical protein